MSIMLLTPSLLAINYYLLLFITHKNYLAKQNYTTNRYENFESFNLVYR